MRLRIDLVGKLVRDTAPDVICLQEIKVSTDQFPYKAFEEMGYEHCAVNGQKGYHGVATLSRIPFDRVKKKGFCGKGDARHIETTVQGTEIHNFYIPAGGDIPDPEENDKFQHKLDFLTEATNWFSRKKGKKTAKRVLLGDLNIAPREHDVWSHKQLLKVVSHTPVEVEHMARLQKSHSWIDVMREQVPEPEKLYTWWSYRAKDWKAANRGRRLDHIWVTPALEDKVGPVTILTEARGWERPSDHAPVITTISR